MKLAAEAHSAPASRDTRAKTALQIGDWYQAGLGEPKSVIHITSSATTGGMPEAARVRDELGATMASHDVLRAQQLSEHWAELITTAAKRGNS